LSALSFPVKDLFEIIDVVQSSDDDRLIGKKIIDTYQKLFGGEQSVFFAPDDGRGGFTDIIKNNIDEKLNRNYKEYYYRFDPLNLMHKNVGEASKADIVRNIDYESCRKSEYYNDFLSPQKIHYKLLAILQGRNGVLGKILLLRSRKSGNFSESALRDAKEITPYLANALENNRAKNELERKNGLLQMIENNLGTGIILLDKSRRIIHVNDRAREICGLVKKSSIEMMNVQDIHPAFMEDFSDMAEELDAFGSDVLSLPRRRVFRNDAGSFSVQSKLVHDRGGSGDSPLFMINIDEVDRIAEPAAEEHLATFNLSEREKEVANQVVKGLHNAEIARNLYISEVTVKKHLQNVFQKTGVDNRAALVYALLSS